MVEDTTSFEEAKILSMSTEDTTRANRLLDNEIPVFKEDEERRNCKRCDSYKEKIIFNKDQLASMSDEDLSKVTRLLDKEIQILEKEIQIEDIENQIHDIETQFHNNELRILKEAGQRLLGELGFDKEEQEAIFLHVLAEHKAKKIKLNK